jgi:hypothetical protein
VNRFKKRLERIEKQAIIERAPVEMAVIYIDAPDAQDKVQQARDEYLKKYGCLDGFRIITTHVPEPAPIPLAFRNKA